MDGIKFARGGEYDQFRNLLDQRIKEYFNRNNITQYANGHMYFKSVLALALWIGSYVALFKMPANGWIIFAAYVFHGLTHIFLAYNIGHDANHGAYSASRKVNAVVGLSFDLVGVSSYFWRLMHNIAHHSHVNIYGVDEAMDSNGVFRFSPDEPWRPIHRYQHIYAPVVYCLITLQWVLVKDFRLWLRKDIGPMRDIRHPLHENIIFFVGKLFYYAYILVIPIIFLPVSWWVIVLGFVVFHAIMGFLTAAIFQTTHLIEGTVYPSPNENNEMSEDLFSHLLLTTADYAWRNRVFNWFIGCLNVHCVHHIHPDICHVHNYHLTHILKDTAAELGLEYREQPSLASAFGSHLRLLRRLGNQREEVMSLQY